MKWVACAVVLFAIAVALPTKATEPDPAERAPATRDSIVAKKPALQAPEIEALFAVDTDRDERAAALQRAVTVAMAGDGPAAFDLGVLYRHGMDHPARAVEKNAETARYWLEKCIDAQDCPALALASLSELELQAGDDKAAMQWAQAWVAIEKALNQARKTSSRKLDSSSYSAYLLMRCFEPLEHGTRDALAAQWFKELLAARNGQLGRMLDYQLKLREGEDERSASFFERKSRSVNSLRPMATPALGLFLFRAAPSGGRAESVTLIEALPGPGKLGAFAGILGRLASKPYPFTQGQPKRYAFIPVQSSDERYGLNPDK